MNRPFPTLEADPSSLTVEGTRQDASRTLSALGIAAKTPSNYLSSPLTREHADEIESISLGFSRNERAREANLSVDEVQQLQKSAIRKTGAKTGPQATRIAIISGLIPIEFGHGFGPTPKIEDQTHIVLALMSLGVSVSAIAETTFLTEHAVREEIHEAQRDLRTASKPNLIRRAFEAGVFADPDTQYHDAVELRTLLEADDVDFQLETAAELTISLILQKGPAA